MIHLDPERLKAAVAAFFGAIFYGLYTFGALVLAGQTPTAKDVIKALVNVACAVVAGSIIAYFTVVAAAAAVPWSALRDPSMLGFAIGAVGWELAPVAYSAAKARIQRMGNGS